MDARTRKVIDDDYMPQNFCFGRPAPIHRNSDKLYDIITIFYYYADGKQRDWKTVMRHQAVPKNVIPMRYYTPAGPAEPVADGAAGPAETEPPEPFVLGPKRKVLVMEYDMGDFFPVACRALRGTDGHRPCYFPQIGNALWAGANQPRGWPRRTSGGKATTR